VPGWWCSPVSGVAGPVSRACGRVSGACGIVGAGGSPGSGLGPPWSWAPANVGALGREEELAAGLWLVGAAGFGLRPEAKCFFCFFF
jgi:hypothetical protein